MKPIVAWINCYGHWDPENRNPVETAGYDQYLTGVTQALYALQDRVGAVYISGGMYDSLHRTECATTAPEILRRLSALKSNIRTILADESSVTSISIAKKFLDTWEKEYPNHAPLLFCDEVRFPANAYVLECLM
ncbi:MAG TPA: hypothetical protein VLA04_03545, partial [Verrucomicrobiae bacterium]|nr:hypothetical protein [Verrucomicrobiae bacterium]